MPSLYSQKKALLEEISKLHERHKLSDTVGPEYYNPGMMEYLDQSDGTFNESTGEFVLKFEAKGTRYDGRTEQIEHITPGTQVRLIRDPKNAYNSNNFILMAAHDINVGNMPAALCNAIAPLYDTGHLVFSRCEVSFVEPVSKRSRYARQAILFVEVHGTYSFMKLP